MAEDSIQDKPQDHILAGKNDEEQNAITNKSQDGPPKIKPAYRSKDDAAEAQSKEKDVSPDNSQDPEQAQKDAEKPKASRFKAIWEGLGLDLPTIIMMFKYEFFP